MHFSGRLQDADNSFLFLELLQFWNSSGAPECKPFAAVLPREDLRNSLASHM
jgi:hypothetical protein